MSEIKVGDIVRYKGAASSMHFLVMAVYEDKIVIRDNQVGGSQKKDFTVPAFSYEVVQPECGKDHDLSFRAGGTETPMGRAYQCKNCLKLFRPMWEEVKPGSLINFAV